MKILAALFVIFTTPFIVFFATIIYNGNFHTNIKQELSKTNLYENLTTNLKTTFTDSELSTGSSEPSDITSVIQNRLTKEYIQEKTETFIDDTSNWLQNKSTTPPVISFKEIKEDLIAQNPGMIEEMNKAIEDMKKQQQSDPAAPEENMNADIALAGNELTSMQSLMESDFSIPVGENITGLKQAYQVLQIALPILAILVLLCIIALLFLNSTVSSRLRWITGTFTISALSGFLVIFFYSSLALFISNLMLGYSNEWMTTITPIITTLLTIFGEQFKQNQTITSIALLSVAALCFILMFIIKPKPLQVLKKQPVVKKKK